MGAVLLAYGGAAVAQTTPGTKEKILFAASGDIWAMDPDGSQKINLTNTPSFVESAPIMSPSGAQIAFVGSPLDNGPYGEAFDIYVVNSVGGNGVKLTNFAAKNEADLGSPTWSPDGTRIAYEHNGDIFAMNADGSGQTQLTADIPAYEPAWSPDGDKFAYASNGDIFTMNADGSGQTNLTDISGVSEHSPAWSSDGARIAYTGSENGGYGDVFAMNADGGGQTNLTGTPGDEGEPAWSPDGARIAYSAYITSGGWKVFAMNADGGGQTNLIDTPADTTSDLQARDPDWGMLVTPPNTTISSKPSAATNETSASFSFSSSEPDSTFKCSLDGAMFSSCVSPQQYSELAEGSHTFRVMAIDAAGNADPTPATFTWKVDREAPTVTILSGNSGVLNYDDASFTFSASESGAKFECMRDTTDPANFASCSSPKDYYNLAEGSHVFRVRAIDRAGNVGPETNRTWRVDTLSPRGTVVINRGATSTRSRSVNLKLSASDPSPGSGLTGMRFSNTGSSGSFTAWKSYSTSHSWTLSSGAGTKTVYVHYRDKAGNIGLAKDTIKYAP